MVGWVNGLLQATGDFLVDERCHACGKFVEPAKVSVLDPARAALASPLLLKLGPFRVATRPLCHACAARCVPFTSPLVIEPADSNREPLMVYPAFEAGDAILAVVHALKFAGRERLGAWLAAAMASSLPCAALKADDRPLLVPVPLDRASARRRGFNQSERIARELARIVEAPLAVDCLRKVRRTAPQSSLGRSERLRNVAGAFAVRSGRLCGRATVLVDDLVTTGATARACAQVLRRAGAGSVRVVCVGYRP